MGKKSNPIRKALNKATKVFTLGAADADQVFDVFTLGQGRNLSDQFLGTDLNGTKQAQKDLDAANARREDQAQTFAQNMSVDLGTENAASVELGGTADAAGAGASRRKKRAPGSSASSSLGINF